MSSVREAVNAAWSVRKVDPNKPLWVALTLADEPGCGLRSGETMAEVVTALEPFSVDAYLFNCTDPSAISVALEELAPLTDKPTGAYPNRFHVPAGWTLDNDIKTEAYRNDSGAIPRICGHLASVWCQHYRRLLWYRA